MIKNCCTSIKDIDINKHFLHAILLYTLSWDNHVKYCTFDNIKCIAREKNKQVSFTRQILSTPHSSIDYSAEGSHPWTLNSNIQFQGYAVHSIWQRLTFNISNTMLLSMVYFAKPIQIPLAELIVLYRLFTKILHSQY